MSRIDELREDFAQTMSKLSRIKEEMEKIEGNEDYDRNSSLVGTIFVKRIGDASVYFNIIGLADNGSLVAIKLFCGESPDLLVETVYFRNYEDVCRHLSDDYDTEDFEDIAVETASRGEFYEKFKALLNILISFRFKE